jgi:hypothetical protein
MNTVTKRFLDCFEQLKRTNKVRSGRHFAVSLDYLPQSFSEIVNGRREVTVELLRKATEQYCLNPAYLLMGQEPMILPAIPPATHNGAIPHNGFDIAPDAHLGAFRTERHFCTRRNQNHQGNGHAAGTGHRADSIFYGTMDCPPDRKQPTITNMKKQSLEGKVIRVAVGPGCWGIVDAKGNEWRPVNMPEQLKFENRTVKVTVEEADEEFDIFMWGTPVKIVSFHTVMP